MIFSLLIVLAVLCVSISAQGKGSAGGQRAATTSPAFGLYEYITITQYYDASGTLTEANACDLSPTHSYTIRPGHCFTHYTTDINGNVVVDSTTPSMSYGYVTPDPNHISLLVTYYRDSACQTWDSNEYSPVTYHNGCNDDGGGSFAKISASNTNTPTINGVSLSTYRDSATGQTECESSDDASSGKGKGSAANMDDTEILTFFFPTDKCVPRKSQNISPNILETRGDYVVYSCSADGTSFTARYYSDSNCNNENNSSAETYNTGDASCSNTDSFTDSWIPKDLAGHYRFDCYSAPAPVIKPVPGLKKNGATKQPAYAKAKKVAARL